MVEGTAEPQNSRIRLAGHKLGQNPLEGSLPTAIKYARFFHYDPRYTDAASTEGLEAACIIIDPRYRDNRKNFKSLERFHVGERERVFNQICDKQRAVYQET